MNIFPKRKQIMLIPRGFTLSSKAFSRIRNDKGSWKCVILFPCHSVKTHCKICFRLFSGLAKPLMVCRFLSCVSQCTLPFFLHCSHTFSFIPSCIQCSLLPQDLCICSLYLEHSSHFTLLTSTHPWKLKSICFLGSFLLWKKVCVHVCTCVCVCASAGLGDSFS